MSSFHSDMFFFCGNSFHTELIFRSLRYVGSAEISGSFRNFLPRRLRVDSRFHTELIFRSFRYGSSAEISASFRNFLPRRLGVDSSYYFTSPCVLPICIFLFLKRPFAGVNSSTQLKLGLDSVSFHSDEVFRWVSFMVILYYFTCNL